MRFYKVGGAGDKQCSWRRVPRHRTEGGGGWVGSAGFAAARASGAGRAQGIGGSEGSEGSTEAWPTASADGWPAAPADGWPASPADGLGMRQRLPPHALVAGNDCRCHGVNRKHSRVYAVCRVGSGWHGDCIRLRAASFAVV